MELKSFGKKTLIFIACIFVGALASNAALLGIFMTQGLEINSTTNISDIFSNEDVNLTLVKIGVGFNHLILFVGTAALFWWLIKENTFSKYFNIRPVKWELLGLFILLLMSSYPLIGASGLLSEYVEFPEWLQGMDDEYAASIEGLFSGEGVLNMLLNLVIIALLPAIGEELIFRGIVQKELHRVIANPHLVIFITSVIFSGIHLQAAGFLPKFLISYILCYSYYWGKSLIYPMILHFINNGSMTLALYFMDDELMDMDQANTPEFPWVGVIISIILCVLLVRMIKAENGPEIAA